MYVKVIYNWYFSCLHIQVLMLTYSFGKYYVYNITELLMSVVEWSSLFNASYFAFSEFVESSFWQNLPLNTDKITSVSIAYIEYRNWDIIWLSILCSFRSNAVQLKPASDAKVAQIVNAAFANWIYFSHFHSNLIFLINWNNFLISNLVLDTVCLIETEYAVAVWAKSNNYDVLFDNPD